jgi:hypothetical protein
MGLSLGLPNLIHIHIFVAQSSAVWLRCHYAESLLMFLNYFIDKLVNNLTNYVGLATGRCSLPAELIQVEMRMCRPRWVKGGCWGYEVVAPSSGLEPLFVPWKYRNQRSRVGCDVCLGPL